MPLAPPPIPPPRRSGEVPNPADIALARARCIEALCLIASNAPEQARLELKLGPHLRIECHHLTHWAQGGSTDLENLVSVCRAHHWKVHEGGWRLIRS